MAKRATKEDKGLNLEAILYNCRDYLRGSASLNDKRDVILTLVFLRFIGKKFDDAQAEMRQKCLDRGLPEEIIQNFLSSPARYKNIVFVPEVARWSNLINVAPTQLTAALDDALQAIEDSGDALKGCVKLSLFTNVNIQPNDLKKVVDEVNKISHKTFGEERDIIGRVYEYFLKSFAVNATKEDGEFYTPHDIVELIDTKSSFADWLTNGNVRANLNQELFFLLAANGYPPEWSDDVFEQVLDQVENFKEYSYSRPRSYDFPYFDNTSIAAEP